MGRHPAVGEIAGRFGTCPGRPGGSRAVIFHFWTAIEPKDELRRHYLEGLELKYRHDGAAALTAREKRDLLWDEEAIHALLLQQEGDLTKVMIAP